MQNNVANHSTGCYDKKVKVLMTRSFRKWARKERVGGDALHRAIFEAESGLIDAVLGHCLIKKRIGLLNKGKRGGLRTIIFFRQGDKSIFLHGFAKNDKDNIDVDEELFFKRLGELYLTMNDVGFERALKNKELFEVLL